MKHLFLLLLFSPLIILSQTIVSTSPENKKAIVEESTGIHCGYCPEGHAILNTSSAQNPGQVLVVKYHEGGYAWDCDPNGGHDFQNQFAIDLGAQANASGQPVASINRTAFGANGTTAISRGAWAQEINNILQQPAYVNVGVEASINDNILNVKVEAYYTDDSPVNTNRLIVALTQDGTVGPQNGSQYNPDYIVSSAPNPNYQHGEYDYLHMDRLVYMLTDINGEPLNNTSSGTFVERCFSYTIPSLYNDVPVDLEQLKVTAYISESNNDIINGAQANALLNEENVCEVNQYEIFLSEIINPSGVVPVDEDETNEVSVVLTNLSNEAIPANGVTVWYEINNEYVSELVPNSINPGSSLTYTFSQNVDLSNLEGTFVVIAGIESEYDTYIDNNTIEIEAEIYSYCSPSIDCSYGDGFQNFTFADINNDSECEGYGDFTDISTDIVQGETYQMSFTTGYGSQTFRVWIDYNDDLYYSLDELIVDNPILANGQGPGTYTGSVEVIIPEDALLGSHLMRIKSAYAEYVPDDPCAITNYGETEDYMVNIVESLSLLEIDNSKIKIYPNPTNGIFNISLTGEELSYEIYNFIGQKIKFGVLNSGNNNLNISNQSNGVYFIKFYNSQGKSTDYKLIKK